MQYLQLYKQKTTSADQAVLHIHSGQWIDYGFAASKPRLLDEALAKRKDDLNDIKIRGGLALTPIAVVECDPHQETFTYASWHFSGIERKYHDEGKCFYIPMLYRNLPSYYERNLTVDVAMLTVSSMDANGYFSFSISNSASRAIVDAAKMVILEINPTLPQALSGHGGHIHISEVDWLVEGEATPLPTLKSAPPTDKDLTIANMILNEIHDGATIQLGIGTMPNTVGALIAKSDLKNLGMHTEMLVDAYFDMYESGRLNNTKKALNPGVGVWTFSLGSEKLYNWIHQNPALASYPVSYTNDPHMMRHLDGLTTINNCVEIDLYGQVCSESAGTRHISGTGGQLDFVTGGYMAKEGKSFVCFSATYRNKSGELKSRIVPSLTIGGIVTDPRTQVHYLVTEFGMVNLAGLSTWERAEAIISIAHPMFRESLIQSANAMKIWRNTHRKSF
jgi:butyryl-CoA:acetate CoA-transferase